MWPEVTLRLRLPKGHQETYDRVKEIEYRVYIGYSSMLEQHQSNKKPGKFHESK